MKIDKTKQMDLIGVDKQTGKLILSILDAMGWEDEEDHLDWLQDKVYHYLDTIETGEMAELYPAAEGRDAQILIHFAGPIPAGAESLLASLVGEAKDSGVSLFWDVKG